MLKTSDVNQKILTRDQASGFCHALSLAWLLHCTKMNEKMTFKVDRNQFCSEKHFYQNPQFYANIMLAQQKLTFLLSCWRYLNAQGICSAPVSAGWDKDIVDTLNQFMPIYASEGNAVERIKIALETMNSLVIGQLLGSAKTGCSFEFEYAHTCANMSFLHAAEKISSENGMLITLYDQNFSLGHTIAFSKFADGIWSYDPNTGCTYGMADDFEGSDYLPNICKECRINEPCHIFLTRITLQ